MPARICRLSVIRGSLGRQPASRAYSAAGDTHFAPAKTIPQDRAIKGLDARAAANRIGRGIDHQVVVEECAGECRLGPTIVDRVKPNDFIAGCQGHGGLLVCKHASTSEPHYRRADQAEQGDVSDGAGQSPRRGC